MEKKKQGEEAEEILRWVLILLKESGQILASVSFSGLSDRWCQKQGWLWGFPPALGAISVHVDSRLCCRGALRGAAGRWCPGYSAGLVVV